MNKPKKVSKKSVKKTIKGRNGGTLNPGYNGQPVPGRPEGSRNRKNIIQELLDMDAPESLLAEVRKLNPSAKTLRDIHTVSTFNRSLKGNPKAMEMMMYYDIGKPKETIEAEITNVNLNVPLTKEELEKELAKRQLPNKIFDK